MSSPSEKSLAQRIEELVKPVGDEDWFLVRGYDASFEDGDVAAVTLPIVRCGEGQRYSVTDPWRFKVAGDPLRSLAAEVAELEGQSERDGVAVRDLHAELGRLYQRRDKAISRALRAEARVEKLEGALQLAIPCLDALEDIGIILANIGQGSEWSEIGERYDAIPDPEVAHETLESFALTRAREALRNQEGGEGE